jgi:hypothetical protein
MSAGTAYKTDIELRGLAHWRVYFNRLGTKAEAFSVDKGNGRARRHFHSVDLNHFESATFRATGKKPDGINPVAWVEVTGRLRAIRRGRFEDAIIGGITAEDLAIAKAAEILRGEKKGGLRFTESALYPRSEKTCKGAKAATNEPQSRHKNR